MLLSQAAVRLATVFAKAFPSEKSSVQRQRAEDVLKETKRQCGPRLVKGE
jgi:hypothetical protein